MEKNLRKRLMREFFHWNAIAIIDLDLQMEYETVIMCCAKYFYNRKVRKVIFQMRIIYLAGHLKGYALRIIRINSLHKSE